MSRIGKKPVAVPSGVTATVDGQTVTVKGPKGELSLRRARRGLGHDGERRRRRRAARRDEGRPRASGACPARRSRTSSRASRRASRRSSRSTASAIAAQVAGKDLKLSLGYSHDVDYPIPAGITIATPKPTEIVVTGIDKQQVGQVAAEIREYRGPEPYKGKGVKYAGEYIFRKEGKKK